MKKRKGFTLVELLVVVAIIALLVTILLPSLSRARALARRTACAATLRSLSSGIKTYDGEYNSYPWIMHTGDRGYMGAMAAAANSSPADDLFSVFTTNSANNLVMLVRKGRAYVSYKAFICAGRGTPINDRNDYGFWGVGTSNMPELQYGYHFGGTNSSQRLGNTMSGAFVIMADCLMDEDTGLQIGDTADLGGAYNHNAAQGEGYAKTASGIEWSHGTNEGANILQHNGTVNWRTTINCDSGGDTPWTNNENNIQAPTANTGDAVCFTTS